MHSYFILILHKGLIPYHTHTNIHLVSCIRPDTILGHPNPTISGTIRTLGPHDYRAPTDLKDYQQYLVFSVAKTD